jgi:hypothetical protein
MKFFDWLKMEQDSPISTEIALLMAKYILIAKTQNFFQEDTPIMELYAKEHVDLIPVKWRNYISLVCEQDVFIMDQVCLRHAFYGRQGFRYCKIRRS